MNSLKRAGLAVALGVALTACGISGASAAVLSTTSNTSPFTGSHQLRSTSDLTFAFSTGTITCKHAYSAIGTGNITNATITNSFANVATIATLNFGKLLPLTATAPSACDTSTIAAISSCTARQIQNVPVQAATNAASPNDTGVTAKLGPLTVIADCKSASDGSTIANCQYTTGPGSAAAITSALSAYSGTPARASTLTFSNQPFYKSAGPAACPAANGTTTGKFSGSFALYASSAAGAAQISAYK